MSNQTTPGFDDFAADYEKALQQGLSVTGESKDYFAQGRVDYLKNLLAELNHQPGKILDFGCGTGTSAPLLMALPGAVSVTGVDISEASLKRATDDHGSATISFATFQQLPPEGKMDLAFCNGVFHHIPLGLRSESMKYIFNSLRRGGIFAFWENNPWNPGTRYVMSRIPFDHDAITLSPPEAGRLARTAGFEILGTRFRFFFPKTLGFLRWMEGGMSHIPLGGQYIVLCRKPGPEPRSAAS
jgi:SAM-dependent methyltransferase